MDTVFNESPSRQSPFDSVASPTKVIICMQKFSTLRCFLQSIKPDNHLISSLSRQSLGSCKKLCCKDQKQHMQVYGLSVFCGSLDMFFFGFAYFGNKILWYLRQNTHWCEKDQGQKIARLNLQDHEQSLGYTKHNLTQVISYRNLARVRRWMGSRTKMASLVYLRGEQRA